MTYTARHGDWPQRQASRRADLHAILSVLDEASAWLQSIGMERQWPASFSGDSDLVRMISDYIGAGQVFACNLDGAVVGCFRQDDVRHGYWPEGDPLYLYSLAVRRDVAGRGLARDMLDWAHRFAGAQGKTELRLDCWAGNTRLRRYYLDAGFTWLGDVERRSSMEDNPSIPVQNRGNVYYLSLFARQAG